jgi:thioesterase domain-containing protein
LFCVAGGGGNILSYRVVADCMPVDQPVYCLQAKGLRRGERPLTTVEEVAEHYLEAVRRVAPRGPYFLTGHSFGAVVAYEMAQRLVKLGERVPLLALLDYPGPDIRLTRFDWFRYHLISLSMQTPRERLHYIWRGILWKVRSARAARRIRESPATPAKDAHESRWRSIDVLEQSMRAIRSYVIKPYEGRVALFRGQHSDPKMVVDRQGGWGRVALEGVDVYDVPGSHMSIFKEPYVRELGAALARHLEKACKESADYSFTTR